MLEHTKAKEKKITLTEKCKTVNRKKILNLTPQYKPKPSINRMLDSDFENELFFLLPEGGNNDTVLTKHFIDSFIFQNFVSF